MQQREIGVSASTSWPRVALLCLVGVTAAFQVGKVPGQLHAMESELDLSLFEAGLVLSIFNLIAALGGVLIGSLGDRFGNLRMIVAGLALGGAAGAIGSLAMGAPLLLATRAVEGFGFILACTATPSLIIAETATADRGKALGLWSAYMPTGMSMMMVIAALLSGELSWRGVWLITAALNLGYAVIVWLAFPEARGAAIGASGGLGRVGLGIRATSAAALRAGPLLLAGCFLVYAGNFLALTGFLPLMLERGGDASGRAAGLLAAVVVAANMTGNWVSGFIAARGIARPLIIAVAAAVMGMAAVGVFMDTLPFAMRYALALVFAAVGGIIPGTCFGEAQELAESPTRVGPIVGALIQGAGLGQLFGPSLVAAIVQAVGSWRGAAAFIAVGAMINVALALSLLRLTQRPRPRARASSI